MKNSHSKDEFKHKIKETVKFHEVDLLGVCNNAVYFNYFEDARLKYTHDLKTNYNLKEFLSGDSFFIMVHNDCDYYSSAHLDDELTILTKVNFVKNSSFGFKHLVEKNSSGEIIASGSGVVVHTNKSTQEPRPLPTEFYDAVSDYEKSVDILKNKD
jgi:acyl-CoA thioester hydrolase